ncbi:MAG: hypothetical protein QF662_07685, partial [Phycisphaerae bacterium]|nr:hypothetical protein [Phycisphaerae bacterium]
KWTLNLKFEAPRPIRIYGTNREPKIYWYILYSARNDSGATRFFAPDFILYTNEAKLHRSGIHPEVHKVIKERRKRRTRFLENSAKIIGNLLEGEDNARDGVAIFAPIGPKTKSFTLFVGGLSGRYILRDNPAAKADTPLAEKKIVLYKTLAVDYKLIGDEWWKDLAAPKVVKTQWTWR